MRRPEEASSEPAERDSRFVYELKFFIDGAQAEALKSWARARLPPDPYGGGPHADTYAVSSLYFDTAAFAVLTRQGSYARSKYRVRRYNQNATIYLERKTRGRYRVFKRRSLARLEELVRLEQAQPGERWDGHWFHRRLLLRELRTVSRIDYQRLARIGQSDYGPVRLTLDQGLQAWSARGLSFEAPGRAVPLSPEQLILELKFGHAMPAVFKELIREFAPRLEGISKYRLACAALGLAATVGPAPLKSAPLRALTPLLALGDLIDA